MKAYTTINYIGDKVQHKGATSCGTVYVIKHMKWVNNHIEYDIRPLYDYNHIGLVTLCADDLQPFKEETMEEKEDKAKAPNLIGEDYSEKRYGYKIPDGYEFDCIKNDEIILKPKQPQYPKICEECCKILKIPTNGDIIYAGNWTWGGEYLDECLDKIKIFQKILICRDAYWKIAGEQMGLGKPWKPSANDEGDTYLLCYNRDSDCFDKINGLYESNAILDFPTKEMRDAFYENFKDLIEECKELL